MIKRIAWMFLGGAWLFVTASFISFSPHDWPSHAVAPLNGQPTNWCGWVGAAIAYQGYHMLGPGLWLILAGIGAYLGISAVGKEVDQLGLRALGLVTMGLGLSAFLNLLMPNFGPMPEGNGGLIAIVGVDQLYMRFNFLGTVFVLAMVFGVGSLLAADEWVMALPQGLVVMGKRIASVNWPKPVLVGWWKHIPRLSRYGYSKPVEAGAPAGRRIPLHADTKSRPAAAKSAAPAAVVELDDPDVEQTIGQFEQELGDVAAKPQSEAQQTQAPLESEPAAQEAEDQPESAEPVMQKKVPLDPAALEAKIKKLNITFASQLKPKHPPVTPVQDLSGYRFPDIALLSDPESNYTQEMDKIIREQAMALEQSLQTYNIDATVVDIQSGPVITLYDVQPAPGVRVSSFNTIASDLARQLKAQNIRIVPNTAGKSTVGIEVPNLKKEKVRLKELMALAGPDLLEKMRLPMFLGKDASGEPLIVDLTQMPHMLIAGTTGSGKSVCMNSIIMSFLYTRRPDELKLVLVDPKMVEMSQFKDIPHLMCPVVTDMNKAAAILEWAVTKMDERYELLAEAGVRDIDSYNKLTWEEIKEVFKPANETEEAQIPKKLPRLVFIIDELADMMMTNKEVETFIVRIAQKARAVGIHLIVATQRPQANVVTGLIKGNMPCRIGFKVASGLDSRIVLDQKGAELLLGQGDMLYLSPRTSKLMRAQATLVDDQEVRATVRFLKNVAQPSFEPQLIQLKAPGQGLEESAERDPMFDDAVRVVLEQQRGSVSLLQRRLGVGYGRASRIIEDMAAAGILGDYKGSQARECNITVEEWQAMKARMEADAAVEVNGALEPDPAAAPVADDETDGLSDEEQELAQIACDEPRPSKAAKEEYEEYEYVDDEEAEREREA